MNGTKPITSIIPVYNEEPNLRESGQFEVKLTKGGHWEVVGKSE